MRILIIAIVVTILGACASKKSAVRDSKAEYIGVVQRMHHPDTKDRMAPGVIVDGKKIILVGKYKAFKKSDYGKRIKVTGALVKKKMPLIVHDERKKKPGEVMPQGITVPKGTDIKKEGVYYIVQNPKWEKIE